MFQTIFRIAFIISASFTLIIALYRKILKYTTSNKKLKINNEIEEYPNITVVIPTFMEENNIKQKINNTLKFEYPQNKMNIIVVDGGSEDDTVQIAKKFDTVKVININQRGKIKAINKALEHSENDLVLLTDADVTIDQNAIKKSIKYFGQDIAAISSKGTINKGNNFYSKSKRMYHHKDFNMRYMESILDNCCSLDGKFILLDTNKVNRIDKSGYTDDFTLTLQIYKKGYKSIVIDENLFYEKSKEKLIDEINQMRRRCKTSIADSFRNIDIIMKNKSPYTLFIFPLRRLLNFFIPLFLLIIGLYTLVNIPVIFSILVITYSVFTYRNIYYNILMISIILAWFDIITLNLNEGAFWEI